MGDMADHYQALDEDRMDEPEGHEMAEYNRKRYAPKVAPSDKVGDTQEIENLLTEDIAEFDPKGHFITITDPHKFYRKIQALLHQKQVEAIKLAQLTIEELASKEIRDGRHRYSHEIEAILERLQHLRKQT